MQEYVLNYEKPISLLPLFGKIFYNVIFHNLINHFIKNKTFTKCQSDFLSGDSCISQLLSITMRSTHHFIVIHVSMFLVFFVAYQILLIKSGTHVCYMNEKYVK